MPLSRDTFHRISVREHGKGSRIARPLLKTITYQVLIACLDFLVIYLLTRELKLAFGFTLVKSLYAGAAYFFHESVWDSIVWGTRTTSSDGA